MTGSTITQTSLIFTRTADSLVMLIRVSHLPSSESDLGGVRTDYGGMGGTAVDGVWPRSPSRRSSISGQQRHVFMYDAPIRKGAKERDERRAEIAFRLPNSEFRGPEGRLRKWEKKSRAGHEKRPGKETILRAFRQRIDSLQSRLFRSSLGSKVLLSKNYGGWEFGLPACLSIHVGSWLTTSAGR